MTRVIGIAGKARVGKTTAANRALEDLGDGWARFGFADPLKHEVARKFGFDPFWCYTRSGKLRVIETGTWGSVTVRELLQIWGTDVRRASDPEYWIKQMRQVIETSNKNLIIDDVRFPNEADLIKEVGDLWYLMPYPDWEPGPHANHASETALDDYPFENTLIPSQGDVEFAGRTIAKAVTG